MQINQNPPPPPFSQALSKEEKTRENFLKAAWGGAVERKKNFGRTDGHAPTSSLAHLLDLLLGVGSSSSSLLALSVRTFCGAKEGGGRRRSRGRGGKNSKVFASAIIRNPKQEPLFCPDAPEDGE